MTEYSNLSLDLHREKRGKWEIHSKFPLENKHDLSLAYTPGVASVSERIANNPREAYNLTMKGNSVAIISDGSAVLGLGDIGPEASLPVMEGKAILFKEFADIDGIPIVLNTHTVEDIVKTVKAIAPTFGGINLEDIKAPKCFAIEAALQDIGIPVFHDDQHGTAVVLLAALINACRITGKKMEDLVVVINGAGAAGSAIAKLLRCIGHDPSVCTSVKHVYLCDSKGLIHKGRQDLHPYKRELLEYTNPESRSGTIFDALEKADVFIGVSIGNLLSPDDIKHMAPDPIILAMANPIPEIMPEVAKQAGAAIVGTGRSDFANQVNNALAFPGIFRGALDAHAMRITESMKIAAAYALADAVKDPSVEKILPYTLDKSVVPLIAEAVKQTALAEGVGRED
ncbi:MAG: NADP-dependent malic enzyme [Chlamydiales bacterium]|nr:NADP-dependent malic enzyme [Chlamydiia bacterium]MCP5507203.1 NADP-dependent malic enzyme [Chlamydiales bacterium]